MKGLGKGLDALLGGYNAPEEKNINNVSIYLIDNNNEQPRKQFDESKLRELADSIEQHGVVQPIIVKRSGERYTIVAGERRYRAARLAGLNEIPVIVRDLNEQEIREIALVENLQRENLNPIEEAAAIRALMDEHDLTQDEVSKKLGKSRSAIANAVRLLNMPERIQELLLKGKLQAGHARVIASIPNDEIMCQLAESAVAEGWSVRETERQVNALLEERRLPKKQPKKAVISTDMCTAQEAMREHLGTKVTFKGSEDKGKIVIEYFSKEELQGIYDLIMSGNK